MVKITDDDTHVTNDIQDAEIVEEAPQNTSSDDSQILLSLDELIKSHIRSIDKIRNELKEQKSMLADGLVNDPVYKENTDKAKEVANVAKVTKANLLKQPAMQQLSQKIRGLSSEVKEKQAALSDYLLEYQRMTGNNQIETDEGEVLEIINQAKVKRPQK